MKKVLFNFAQDIINTSTSSSFSKFFYRTRVHVIIVLLISSSKSYTYEKICNEIPGAIGSRSTIKSVLDDGTKQSFFQKIVNEKDKRNKIYILNKDIEKNIKVWVTKMKKIFK